MVGLVEAWSNIEVHSVIRCLRLKGTSPAEIHHKLAEVYGANVMSRNTFGWRYNWEVLDHPPYSPGLALSDFHLFGLLKKHLG
jgi:hypothetical protein